LTVVVRTVAVSQSKDRERKDRKYVGRELHGWVFQREGMEKERKEVGRVTGDDDLRAGKNLNWSQKKEDKNKPKRMPRTA